MNKNLKKIIKKKQKYNYLHIILSIFVLILFSIALLLFIYSEKTLPNTKLGKSRISGLNFDQTKIKIDQIWGNKPKELRLVIDEKVYTINYEELGLKPIEGQILNNIWVLGRKTNLTNSLSDQIKSLTIGNRVSWDFSYNQVVLMEKIKAVEDELSDKSQSPVLENNKGELVFKAGKDGKYIDTFKLISEIEKNWSLGEFEKIYFQTEQSQNGEKSKQLEEIANSIKPFVHDYKIKVGSRNKKVPPEDFLNWLEVISEDNQIKWSFNEGEVYNYLNKISGDVRVEPKNARLTFRDGIVTVITEAIDGTTVELNEGTAQLIEGIKNNKSEIELPVKPALAEVTRANINELGIKEIIGSASTSFSGSSANRKHNIANGASILNGAVVKPGQEFSTAVVMGEVDDTSGFLPELVIKGDKTIPEFGGGLCQVSTTLFRSVLNASLRVTARQNHSYRVRYYEPPLGLDATIYLPNPDFKFFNDTNNYILVQSRIEGSKVIFELYGTKDGRTSSISDTEILSTTPAGPPQYTDTDQLFKGETKKLESAHDGATTVVRYVVTKDNKELFKQTFRSIYKPWPEKWLVGTKDRPEDIAPAPAPEPTPTPNPEPSPVPAV